MSWKNNKRIIKHATPVRIMNAIKILLSYYFSRLIRKPLMFGRPISASIEPTTACNLRCPQCPSGLRSFTRDTGKIDIDLYKNILDDMHPHLWYLTLYFQGEPYIHPQFHEMVKLAKKKRIFVATSTNAHFLDDKRAKATVESGLDKLIISVDGLSQETYEKYRIEGRLKKVEEGMRNIAKWKKKLKSQLPHVVMQYIVMGHNEHEIGKVRGWARERGVDELQLKTAQIYDYENGGELMPENSDYSRYEAAEGGTFRIKNTLYDHCWRMWHSCVITWDGNVVPCCFDKDAKYVMGNAKDQSFKYIWNSTAYDRFRSQLIDDRKEIDICQNCTEGTKIWI